MDVSTTRGEPSNRPPRVKDTCDMCSASKVRCDKRKPLCGRCERLGYPCFYSPARRIRKHPIDETSASSEDQPSIKQQCPGWRKLHTFMDDDSALGERKAMDDFETLNDGQFTEGDTGSMLVSAGNQDSSILPTPNTMSPSSSRTGDITGRRSLQMTPPKQAADCQRVQSPSLSDSNLDCVKTAPNMLQSLQQASTNIDKSTSLESIIDLASNTVRQASTILVCPCSRKTDVGMLVSANCSALLDIYEEILTRIDGIDDAAPNLSQRAMKGYLDPMNRAIVDPSLRAKDQDTLQGGKVHFMSALRELPKVADLMSQFRSRYTQDADPSSRDLFKSLAASLTSRLQTIINDFTQAFIDS